MLVPSCIRNGNLTISATVRGPHGMHDILACALAIVLVSGFMQPLVLGRLRQDQLPGLFGTWLDRATTVFGMSASRATFSSTRPYPMIAPPRVVSGKTVHLRDKPVGHPRLDGDRFACLVQRWGDAEDVQDERDVDEQRVVCEVPPGTYPTRCVST